MSFRILLKPPGICLIVQIVAANITEWFSPETVYSTAYGGIAMAYLLWSLGVVLVTAREYAADAAEKQSAEQLRRFSSCAELLKNVAEASVIAPVRIFWKLSKDNQIKINYLEGIEVFLFRPVFLTVSLILSAIPICLVWQVRHASLSRSKTKPEIVRKNKADKSPVADSAEKRLALIVGGGNFANGLLLEQIKNNLTAFEDWKRSATSDSDKKTAEWCAFSTTFSRKSKRCEVSVGRLTNSVLMSPELLDKCSIFREVSTLVLMADQKDAPSFSVFFDALYSHLSTMYPVGLSRLKCLVVVAGDTRNDERTFLKHNRMSDVLQKAALVDQNFTCINMASGSKLTQALLGSLLK